MLSDRVAPDRGSWPAPLGSLRNDRRAATAIDGVACVGYSVALTDTPVRAITVAAGGIAFISADQTLRALARDRQVWTVPTASYGGCLLIANELLVVADLEGLAVRSQRDGGLVSRISAGGRSSAPTLVGEHLVFAQDDGPGALELRAVTLDGSMVWARPLSHWSPDPPVVVDAAVAVADGSTLRWFAADGERLAEHAAPDGAQVLGPLIGLSDGSVLTRYEGGDIAGWATVAPGSGMRPIPAHLPLRDQVACDGTRLALGGWQQDGPDGPSRQSLDIVLLSDGSRLHREILSTPVVSVVAGAAGEFAFAASPTRARWDAYRRYPGFEPSTTPTVGLVAGNELAGWWEAPAPIVGPLAVGAKGELLVPAGDRLYALTR